MMTLSLGWNFLFVIAVSRLVSGLDYEAVFSMQGNTGTVTFSPNGGNMDVAATNFAPNASVYDVIMIKEYPAIFGQVNNAVTVCEDLGEEVVTLNGARSSVTDSGFQLTQSSLTEDDIFHRGLVLMASGGVYPTICATILPVDKTELVTYSAMFVGPVVGVVWMRKRSSLDGAFLYSDLALADGESVAAGTQIVSLSTHSSGNIGTTDFATRCDGLTGPAVLAELEIGNSPSSAARKSGTFIASVTTIEASPISMTSINVTACAYLASVAARSVTSSFAWRNVEGYMRFEQRSPFDVTMTRVVLDGFEAAILPSTYHIHEYPVPQRLTNEVADRCSSTNVGGHFNPLAISVALPAGTGTGDQYEIGDLSGKYGPISTASFNESYYDWNLPLWGPNRVAGRSIVIHQTGGTRYICSNIDFEGGTTIAVVNFRSPVYGTMYLRQATGYPESETAVFGQIANLNGVSSSGHNYHVHVYPVGEDGCGTAGGHYNPTEVSVAQPRYGQECSSEFPYRCELGDLSGKQGSINIASSLQNGGRFFYQDNFVPLSGAYNVIGRSIVIHSADGNGARYACANITQLLPLTAATAYNVWRGDDADGDVTGSFSFTQNSEYDVTQVNSDITGVGANSNNFGISDLPILSSTSGIAQCDSVGSIYNPFDVTSVPPTRGTDTNDQYPVGSISGKTGTSPDNINYQDRNLPLGTPVGATGRGMSIYRNGESWKCNNVQLTSSGNTGYVIEAEAVFTGSYVGSVALRQVVYEDGSNTPTSVQVQMYAASGVNSTGHNWHIHIQPITDQSSCGIAEGHYDPYNAVGLSINYSASCNKYNPLACEVGDLSNKLGRFDFNPANRQLYTDVDVPLNTGLSVLGRSIVFHAEDGGGPRLACANILPVASTKTYTLAFPASAEYDYFRFQYAVASVLNIERLRVVIVHNNNLPHNSSDCLRVMVAIAGPVDPARETALLAGTGLDPYLPFAGCINEEGLTVLGIAESSGSFVQFNSLLITVAVAWIWQLAIN